MSWIETIGYESSDGRLRRTYNRVRGPDGQIDNILRLHSLRPHTLEGHLALYKSALHHTGNRLPVWLLEAIGTYVSLLNGCDYCRDHHFEGLRRLGSTIGRRRSCATRSASRAIPLRSPKTRSCAFEPLVYRTEKSWR